MTEATDLASAIGQCVGAAAAILGLGFIGWQVREARKTSDIQSLQAFLRDTKEHEHALLEAKTADAKDQAFIEFLNFLEAYAAAINGGLFSKITRDIVREKLIDSIAVITESEAWHAKLVEAVTSETTFQCLRQFAGKEKVAIKAVVSARASLTR